MKLEMKTKAPLGWFGSDAGVAKDLAAMLDSRRHVTILFAGGLAILPHLKAKAVVANDLHNDAMNFYRVMSSDEAPELIERCELTLSHPAELETAIYLLSVSADYSSDVDRAWAFWALCWLGRKGKGGCGDQNKAKTVSLRRRPTGGNNASRIIAAAGDLKEWQKQFKRCEWEQSDFRVVAPKVADSDDCALYIDAPWDGPGAGYLHSFAEQDHIDLRDQAKRFEKTTVLIRYGDTPLIRELYPEGEWEIIEGESRTQSNGKTPELWIIKNYSRPST